MIIRYHSILRTVTILDFKWYSFRIFDVSFQREWKVQCEVEQPKIFSNLSFMIHWLHSRELNILSQRKNRSWRIGNEQFHDKWTSRKIPKHSSPGCLQFNHRVACSYPLARHNAIKTSSNSTNSGDTSPVPRSQVKLSPGLNSRWLAEEQPISLCEKEGEKRRDGPETAWKTPDTRVLKG